MRIDVKKADEPQCTALWFASHTGHLHIVRLILASGRNIETQTKSIAGTSGWKNKTAAGIARFQDVRKEPPERIRRSTPTASEMVLWLLS